ENLFGFSAETFANGIDDPSIGLVGNDAFDPSDINLTTRHRFRRGCMHRLDRILESFFAFHSQVVQPGCNRFSRGRTATSPAGHEQEISLFAISTHHGSEKAVRMGTVLKHCSTCSIAEENAGVSVLPVYN